jgi:hypothetical protein
MQRIDAMREEQRVEERLAASFFSRRVKRQADAVHRRIASHVSLEHAALDAAQQARAVSRDAIRLTRQDNDDAMHGARHTASRPAARIASSDGVVRQFDRDAGRQATRWCVGTPDAFSYNERDAMRGKFRGDASRSTHGVDEFVLPRHTAYDTASQKAMPQCVVADWAGAARHSATGDRASRQMQNANALCQMARDAMSRTDAVQLANTFRHADLLHRDNTRIALINALGYGKVRQTTQRVRKAFLAAMR